MKTRTVKTSEALDKLSAQAKGAVGLEDLKIAVDQLIIVAEQAAEALRVIERDSGLTAYSEVDVWEQQA